MPGHVLHELHRFLERNKKTRRTKNRKKKKKKHRTKKREQKKPLLPGLSSYYEDSREGVVQFSLAS